MKSKAAKKRALLNTVMVAAVVVIAVTGILMVGEVQGWFEKTAPGAGEDGVEIAVSDRMGSANIYRGGVAYAIKDSTRLRDGDEVETLSLSQLTLSWGESGLVLDESSRLSVGTEDGRVTLELLSGAFCARLPQGAALRLRGEDIRVGEDAVILASTGHGNSSLSLLRGTAALGGVDLRAGEELSLPEGQEGDVFPLRLTSLTDFALRCLDESAEGLCFTAGELRDLSHQRQRERSEALEASFLEGDGQDGEGETLPVCTIEILCTEVLENMDSLAEGKDAYVPADGVILPATRLTFHEGESAYDALNRACTLAGIQMESAWTPLYNSYYVQGVNHLYEFDCGEQSGWLYLVNGWSPNYTSDRYLLSDGDAVTWYYTCRDLAAGGGTRG